jgi:hypothetical protein
MVPALTLWKLLCLEAGVKSALVPICAMATLVCLLVACMMMAIWTGQRLVALVLPVDWAESPLERPSSTSI